MTPEAAAKADIKKGLKARGIWYFMPVQTGYGVTSIDFICCWHGRFLAIEAKAEDHKPTWRQQTTLGDITRAGGLAIYAYNWAGVEEALNNYEHPPTDRLR